MEKNFNQYKKAVADDGFSKHVMSRVVAMSPPSKSLYRTPTLIVTLATTAAIVILTLTVGLGTLNEKYDACVKALAYNYENVEIK